MDVRELHHRVKELLRTVDRTQRECNDVAVKLMKGEGSRDDLLTLLRTLGIRLELLDRKLAEVQGDLAVKSIS